MASLSYLAKIQNKKFTYYTRVLSKYLKDNIDGNLAFALKNGMNLIEIEYEEFDKKIASLSSSKTSFLIDQGGRGWYSEYGIKELADELDEYIKNSSLKEPKIFLTSGTGTTALYLQKNLNYPVYTVACVGDNSYLKEQFNMLDTDPSNHPIIINTDQKYRFAKPHKNLLQRYNQLIDETGIEFDLIYDSIGWDCVLSHKELFISDTIYILQGGVRGNLTQLKRYGFIHN
jgi:1-aminocyclopropane-1-carboxylate deaminase/D-cysteine desulfhydrase-like pyridoxal-dependent ACC family enzyme